MSTIVRNNMPPIVNAADILVYIRIIEINTLSLQLDINSVLVNIYTDRYVGNEGIYIVSAL